MDGSIPQDERLQALGPTGTRGRSWEGIWGERPAGPGPTRRGVTQGGLTRRDVDPAHDDTQTCHPALHTQAQTNHQQQRECDAGTWVRKLPVIVKLLLRRQLLKHFGRKITASEYGGNGPCETQTEEQTQKGLGASQDRAVGSSGQGAPPHATHVLPVPPQPRWGPGADPMAAPPGSSPQSPGPPCLPLTLRAHTLPPVPSLARAPHLLPSVFLSIFLGTGLGLGRWGPLVRPTGGTSPPVTWLGVADGRAAGPILGTGWRAWCPQGPSLCQKPLTRQLAPSWGWGQARGRV